MELFHKNHFFARKLHSLAGVIPVGLFLLEHMISNAEALKGPEAYNGVIKFLQSVPLLPVVEIFLIALPLYFHAIYGVFILLQADNNVSSYSYGRNWMFFLQRVAGFIVLIFVTYHIFALRLASAFFGKEVSYAAMVTEVSNPLMFAFYALGVISAAFHFTNGLYTFGIAWGITIGPKAQRVMQYVWGVLFILMSVAGVGALFAFVS